MKIALFQEKQKKDEYLKNNFDPTILPEKQLLVYGIISSHPGLNTREIANLLLIKKTSVENAIKLLRKKGIIDHIGSRSKGGYIIKKTDNQKI